MTLARAEYVLRIEVLEAELRRLVAAVDTAVPILRSPATRSAPIVASHTLRLRRAADRAREHAKVKPFRGTYSKVTPPKRKVTDTLYNVATYPLRMLLYELWGKP